jgi:Domain of unknown function (DUF4388)
MALEGSLQVFNLQEILQMIALQQKTGILTIQGESDIVAISFLKGQVVAADALNQTVEERLGKGLVARGLVRAQDLAAVVAEQQKGGGRPIDLLVSGGFTTRAQILAALRSQTAELLLEVVRWRTGDFKFYSGEEVSYEEGLVPISVQELIVSSLPVETTAPVRAAPTGVPSAPPPSPTPVAARTAVTPSLAAPVLFVEDLEMAPSLPALAPPAMRQGDRPGSVPAESARTGTEAAPAPASPAPPASRRAAGDQAPAASRPAQAAWVPNLVAVAAFGCLIAVLVFRGGRLGLPFPGQTEALSVHQRLQSTSRYQKLDGAARTYFLLEGRYPENLRMLVELGLLSGRDLADEHGRSLAYSSSGLQYTVGPMSRGESSEPQQAGEAVTGNFLLDAEFLRSIGRPQQVPLVLLD